MKGRSVAAAASVAVVVCCCLLVSGCDQNGSLGRIQANSTPTGAVIWLDSTNTGKTTNYLLFSLQPGQHTIKLTLVGYRDWTTGLTVVAGQTAPVDAVLSVLDSAYVLTGMNAQGFEEYLCLRDSSIMVKIPAGTFTMGDTVNSDEMPVHSVYLDEYLIDKCEITNKQYKRFCDATGTAYPDDPGFSGMDDYFVSFPDYPVVMVDWIDASAYATWAHKSIATEAQWEKAGRGTDARRYPWGNAESDSTLCNMNDGDAFSYTSPAGHFAAGASFYGCMDLAGNVWEWCEDWYDSDYYAVSPDSNPTGPASGYDRVAKGGSYNNSQSVWVRCAERYWGPPSGGNHPALGFRCAVIR